MADTKHPAAAVPPVEGDGVSYAGIVWFVVILTATTLGCQGLMWGMLWLFKHQATPVAVSPVAAAVGERQALEGRVYPDVHAVGNPTSQPKLLVNEPANLSDFRAKEHETLSTYGWVDKNAGVVRIPIERAKELILERGFPTRGTDAPKDVSGKDVKGVKDVKKAGGK
jgi:hypothetical protein